jgi:hypothetical protein
MRLVGLEKTGDGIAMGAIEHSWDKELTFRKGHKRDIAYCMHLRWKV